MADDRDARIAQLEAELAAIRGREAALEAQVVGLERDKSSLVAERDEALKQQTASSEILRVIAAFSTHIQTVLDTVVEKAARLCGATDAIMLRHDGEWLQRLSASGPMATELLADNQGRFGR